MAGASIFSCQELLSGFQIAQDVWNTVLILRVCLYYIGHRRARQKGARVASRNFYRRLFITAIILLKIAKLYGAPGHLLLLLHLNMYL